ncbi:hypothetical protein [Arthrobacter sp.]|uniref:hypothetical protein n=1 Tax=Arthrobacter sp. TaxID=1667 RepID=UPI00281180C2|nr:hypothetical protein [Arthrobacter sp.]
MTQDRSNAGTSHAGEGSAQEEGAPEGNPSGGSPTFPNPSTARPTGDTTGFNGSYTETEHHTQHEYDAEHQQNPSDDAAAEGSDQEDHRS